MASNYTSSYQLCQWEANDKVLRTDFNGDNAKIDAALAAHDGELDALTAALAGKADASALPQFVTGSYVGTGEEDFTAHYNLGFRPKMVVLRTENTYSGNSYDVGLILTEVATITFRSNGAGMRNTDSAGLEDTGFYITHGSPAVLGLNNTGKVQHYWAWR